MTTPSDDIKACSSKNNFRIISLLSLTLPARSTVQSSFFKFYVVGILHFGMKFCNEQRNAQVFSLFIYLLLSYMFRAFF
jgi:hypothetical protein